MRVFSRQSATPSFARFRASRSLIACKNNPERAWGRGCEMMRLRFVLEDDLIAHGRQRRWDLDRIPCVRGLEG